MLRIQYYLLHNLEDRGHARSPYRQCLWPSLYFGDWRVAIDKVSVRVVLDHELARVEPILKLKMRVSD
jgi:hypothetical protein